MVEVVGFRFGGCRALHLPPYPHIESHGNRHHRHGTDSQDKKPPEHPHNLLRIADGRLRIADGRRRTCVPNPRMIRERGWGQPFFADLAIALRRFATFFETRSSRLRAAFDPVATFSMFDHELGLFIFWRSYFRNGWILAKMKNISALQPGCTNSSSCSAPCNTNDAAISQ